MLESDRPIALREAIMACRNGGTISVIGVYGGVVDTFPLGTIMSRALTIKAASVTSIATCAHSSGASRMARSTRRW